MATISTASASPISANATTNAVLTDCSALVWPAEGSQDTDPVTARAGSTCRTAARSAVSCAPVPALRNVYSICTEPAAARGRSAATSPGVTQASSSRTTDPAYPTTVSVGCPGALVTVTVLPIGTCSGW